MKINIQSIFLILLLPVFASSCSTSQPLTKKSSKETVSDSIATEAKRKNAMLFSAGLAERLVGNDEKAIAIFEQALKADAKDHASMYELSELLARRQRLDESLRLLKNAVQLQPENEWYNIRLAQLYKYKGDYEAYAQVYRNLLNKQPGNLDYFGELSSALIMLEKYDEAIKLFNEIEKQIGINETLSIQKQTVYHNRKEHNKAILEIEKLSDAFPYETRYHAMLAELYMKFGPKEKAIQRYQKIIQLDPADPYIHISMAEYYRDQGDEQKAFEELISAFSSDALDIKSKVQFMLLWFQGQEITKELDEKAIQIAELFIKLHPTSSQGYQLMADVKLRAKEYQIARENILRSVSIETSNYAAWETLLYLDIQLSDFASLAQHAQQARKFFPEQPAVYLYEGIANIQLKNYELALKSLELGRRMVVANDVLLAEFYSSIGDTQNKLNNHIASDAAYEKALSINPENSYVLNNFAYYLSLRGEKLEKALKMAEKAVELNPENASFLDTYAWVFYKLSDFAMAQIWIEKAIQFSKEPSGTVIEHHGDILYKLGKKAEAIEQWKKAKLVGDVSVFLDKKIKEGKLYE